MPVVSSSSPPDRNGVGSASSEMWTQRTGTSRCASPASARTSAPSRSSRTVSIPAATSARADAARRLLEDRAQDRLDLLELLGPGDQRGRQLDHRVAAIVGAANQPAAEELGRQEAAQEVLGLLVVEGRLGLAVLDELDRVEVAHPADVPDDRDVAQRLEHVAERGLVGTDVLEDALVLEGRDVRERDRGGDG